MGPFRFVKALETFVLYNSLKHILEIRAIKLEEKLDLRNPSEVTFSAEGREESLISNKESSRHADGSADMYELSFYRTGMSVASSYEELCSHKRSSHESRFRGNLIFII